MHSIKILDVTLRDGGYRNNFHFNTEQIHCILSALDQANIEYIEIGYRNSPLNITPNVGITGVCSKEYLLFCRKLIKNSKIAVMVHPKHITSADLEELKLCGVDLVRIAIAKDGYENAIPVIEKCAELGLVISVNFTRMSRYTEEELDDLLIKITKHPINMIYFADSNGSMLPSDLHALYKKYTSQYSVDFGFHAHDNLGMAQANSVAAVEAGVKLIDVSLSGMGKGIGNLKAEFFIAYLHALKGKKYDLDKVRMASNFIRQTSEEKVRPIELNDFMMGILDLSIDDIKKQSLQKSEPAKSETI